MATDCIAGRVRLNNRVLTALYDEALRPHGLRVSQGNILVAVACLGGARPAEVGRVLRLEKSTLSRDVEVMKREGWLESDPPTGGRNQVLRVTSEGIDILKTAQPARDLAQAEARLLVGESGVDALHKIAERLGLGPSPT